MKTKRFAPTSRRLRLLFSGHYNELPTTDMEPGDGPIRATVVLELNR